MSIRLIMCCLTGGGGDGCAMAASLSLAQRFDSHFRAVHVTGDMIDHLPYVDESMPQRMIAQEFEAMNKRRDAAEARARETYQGACAEAAVPLKEAPDGSTGASASWRSLNGRADQVLSEEARIHDLVVMSAVDRHDVVQGRDVVESALFGAGRPVLVVPDTVPESLGDRVFIAWNRSTQSARAVAGAMPLIAAAHDVTIGYVDTGAKTGPGPDALVESLAWHGIEADIQRIAAEGGPVHELLLSRAADGKSDLMIMGAYSHSRLREMVMGGVTRNVLNHPSLATLMVH